jgi:hypothetical protein
LTLDATEVTPATPVRLSATLDDTRFVETVVEPVQAIAAAEYYVDVPPWITATTPVSFTMAAVDGALDSAVETVEATVDTTGWADAQHTLFVRGRDAAGNWGPVSAIFLRTAAVIAPSAGFSSNSPVPLGTPAVFTNTSSGSNLTYSWDFGDGTAPSNEVNPTHTYTTPLTYTVTLTAANGGGSSTYTDTMLVVLGSERHLYFPFIRRPLP